MWEVITKNNPQQLTHTDVHIDIFVENNGIITWVWFKFYTHPPLFGKGRGDFGVMW
jgi:hypothetical protein